MAVVPRLPPVQEFSTFDKVYATYRGVFIILAVLWGWGVDHRRPDLSEWIGAAICLAGVTTCWPNEWAASLTRGGGDPRE
ncbi:MAG: hypothetical protein C7B47_12030 [Sulfobacillus thermosulfidooxidans]|uniref:Uncharacterized protein n=1 Tax=Sulfobacillus thermosulfidooxidans TaxID=28034 RepID=A0A2T2WTN1_SULTH|nr:MAG: hypothetical protein C7B47_12030 [Sulfobacillus thermosulfidooxidans]